MKTTISMLALVAGLSLAAVPALAQDPPSGGPTAKGNAPVKHMHTVNDGTAKAGANSFTQNEARKHILNSGYTDVSGLAKGKDGVWRGTATKGGVATKVALDFKGNVSEGDGGDAAAAPAANGSSTTTRSTSTTSTVSATTPATAARETGHMGTGAKHHHRGHWRRHRHHGVGAQGHCAHPGPNGVACSGIDKNRNGVSDKEDRAIKGGAKP